MQRPVAKMSMGAWIGTLAAACLLMETPAPAIGQGRTGSTINCDVQKGPCEKIMAGTKIDVVH